jgi:hypothetical protein
MQEAIASSRGNHRGVDHDDTAREIVIAARECECDDAAHAVAHDEGALAANFLADESRQIGRIIIRLVGGRLDPFAVAMATHIEGEQAQVTWEFVGDPLPPPCVGGIAVQQDYGARRGGIPLEKMEARTGRGKAAARRTHSEAALQVSRFFGGTTFASE